VNCRPGDLTIVVRGQKSLGRIVKVIRVLQVGERVAAKCGQPLRVAFDSMWLLEGFIYLRDNNGKIWLAPACSDHALRPIRDPGDDAQDEMLRPLPQEIAA